MLNSTYNSSASFAYNGYDGPRNQFDSENDTIKGGEGSDVLWGRGRP